MAYISRYRRKAALTRSFNWGTIDSSLYSECFAGRAKARSVCNISLSESHLERSCPLTMTMPHWLVYGSRGVVFPDTTRSNYTTGSRIAAGHPPRLTLMLCGLFNRHTGNECTYIDCKFAHICSFCRLGPHPASKCTRPCRALLSLPATSDQKFLKA